MESDLPRSFVSQGGEKILPLFLKLSLAFSEQLWYSILAETRYPGVAQLVARLTGGQEAVSSSLATRTRKFLDFERNQGIFLTIFAKTKL